MGHKTVSDDLESEPRTTQATAPANHPTNSSSFAVAS
jgi:hypothetical protein